MKELLQLFSFHTVTAGLHGQSYRHIEDGKSVVRPTWYP